MYGAYFAAAARAAESKKNPKKKADPNLFRWFTCVPCDVLWKTQGLSSHCFVCGKFGTRGQVAYA